MSVQCIYGPTRSDLKLSGASATAGNFFKIVGNNEIAIMTAVTDKAAGVFLHTVTATDRTKLGKNNEIFVAMPGATIKSTVFETTDAPTAAGAVYHDANGKPKGGTSGAGTFASGLCYSASSSEIEFVINDDKAADF